MIDIAIVVVFLILTLIVGLGHGQKVKNIKDYALGGRNFSTAALVATMVATWASGSGFFITLTKTYTDGFYYLIATLCMGIQLLITAFFLVPRMGEFLGSTSVASAMGKLYGKEIRIITAIAGAIGSVGLIAVQFKAFGSIISYFSNLSPNYSIIISGAIVTYYSSMGGVRAVTITDILQMFAFCFALPLIGIVIWNQLYLQNFSIDELYKASQFNISQVLDFRNPSFLEMIPLMFYFTIPTTLPAIFQRISMAQTLEQIKKVCIISAVILVIVKLTIAWVPILLYSVNPNLQSNEILGFIIDHYTYSGLKGVLIVGVIAMAMSTADSNMNISAVLFSNDVFKPLGIFTADNLYVAKICTIILGISGIILAIAGADLLSIVMSTNSFYMPIVTVPLILTILGFRSTKYSVLAGMAAGLITIIYCKIKGDYGASIIYAMIANILFLFAVHYISKQKGGWVSKLEKPKQNAPSLYDRFYKFYQNNSFSFVEYCRYKSPSEDFSYIGLGIYFIIFTITTMYNTQICISQEHCSWIIYVYQIMMVCSILFTSYSIWPTSISPEKRLIVAQVLWPLAIFFMLVLCNSFFVLISNFSSLQFAIFTVNLLITAHMFGWRVAPFLIILGCISSVSYYRFMDLEQFFSSKVDSPAFIIIYILSLIGATLVIFLKPKQEHQEATEAKVGTLEEEVADLNEQVVHYSERVEDQSKEIERLGATAQRILNNVNHELRLPVGNVMNFAEMLNDGLGKFNEEQLKMLSDEVYQNSNRLSSMIMNMLDLATLEAKKIELNKSTINFGELVRDRVQSCRKMYLEDKKIDFEMQIEEDVLIKVDPNYMRQAVDNLVINAINFSTEGVIRISVLRKGKGVEFVISDNGIGILKEDLYDIFTPFKMGSNAESKAEGRGVGLALCKAAVEAHGGSISAASKGGKGAQFRFVL